MCGRVPVSGGCETVEDAVVMPCDSFAWYLASGAGGAVASTLVSQHIVEIRERDRRK